MDVHYKEIESLTPLECAVSKGHVDVLEMLVSAECARPPAFHVDVPHVHDKLPAPHAELLQDYFSHPLSLKRACRRVLRGILGIRGNYARKIGRLGLPRPLQRFLQFEEIRHYGESGYSKGNEACAVAALEAAETGAGPGGAGAGAVGTGGAGAGGGGAAAAESPGARDGRTRGPDSLDAHAFTFL